MSKTIIVAIDETDLNKAKTIIENLDNEKCMLKIGSVSFNSIGHEIIWFSSQKGFEIFLDLKLHDIPNTVKKSIEGLKLLPINMLTIHCSGGSEMMRAAMDAVSDTDIKIFGVTALTSLDDENTNDIYKRTVYDHVNYMLDLAETSGINGIVCSPHELNLVTKRKNLLSITPGIRLEKANDDQKRVMTPSQAVKLGANHIVIGRPITSSNNINKSLNDIYESIK